MSATATLERPHTRSNLPAPRRSHLQRLEALERANDIRLRRAQLKRDLKAGRQDLLSLVLHPPEWLLTAKVYDMVLAMPKVGRVKAQKVLTRQKISASKTFGGLTDRQRRELRALLHHSPTLIGLPS